MIEKNHEKVYNILNWNTGLSEGENNQKISESVFEFVEDFLKKENPVVILQQIPYKRKDENEYTIHPVYEEFCKKFSEEYVINKNSEFNNGFILMMTVIITKKDNVLSEDDLKELYTENQLTNREVAIKFKDSFSVLGVHARSGEENEEYINSIKEKADVIAGDFNAGDYEECENKDVFRSILPSYVCLCNLPTKYILNQDGSLKRETCIDHIFVRRSLVTMCSDVVVHNNVYLSDHYPITFKIKDKKM